MCDAHFPSAPAGALDRTPKPTNAAEVEFLALGDGARLWLAEAAAAAAGTTKMRLKMVQALALAKLFDATQIDAVIHQALGSAQSVLNVGADAGSYEPVDRNVLAVEPSAAMRAHRIAAGAVPAIDRVAESLSLDAASVDAAMAILTIHQ